MDKKTGFTLVELLVTIAILGILASIAAVVYSGVTAKARDSQRIKSLQVIKQALELYRSDVHNYPASLVLTGRSNLNYGSAIYLSPIPEDMDSSRNYYYSATYGTGSSACDNTSPLTTCNYFILCARKDGTDTANDLSACGSYSCGSGNCNIGITSQ